MTKPTNTIKRRWDEYPAAYLHVARSIATAAIPTHNEHFDEPILHGPYESRRAINVYRAEWHRFRGALRISAQADASSYAARLHHILETLTTISVSRLNSDGTEKWWIEFAPHPTVLSAWRNDKALFNRERQRHDIFRRSSGIIEEKKG